MLPTRFTPSLGPSCFVILLHKPSVGFHTDPYMDEIFKLLVYNLSSLVLPYHSMWHLNLITFLLPKL